MDELIKSAMQTEVSKDLSQLPVSFSNQNMNSFLVFVMRFAQGVLFTGLKY